MIRLVARRQRSQAMVWGAPLLAVVLTLITGGLTFAIMGKPMGAALFTFFVQPLTSVYGVSELIVKASPLVLIGIGLSLGFRGNVWNIGAEGQYTFGAILGGGIAIFFHDSTSAFLLPAMLIAGAIGGMAWAAIPAFLRTRFNANEILVSLMLTYVAVLLLSYLVHGPWRDPDGYNFPESRLFPEAGTMPVLIEGTRVHLGVFFALIAVGVALLLGKGLTGVKLKLVGLAPEAARFAGFSETRVIWFALLAGGGLAGLAGVIEVAGPLGQLISTISPGYGFSAIFVAFFWRVHPLGVFVAGLVLGVKDLGG
ncbi:MAG: ABC transporter permease, partial [Alphaproteobacteria bacterium]|nr:ABC transporter permease [Alphaproteobacteria bacterium]